MYVAICIQRNSIHLVSYYMYMNHYNDYKSKALRPKSPNLSITDLNVVSLNIQLLVFLLFCLHISDKKEARRIWVNKRGSSYFKISSKASLCRFRACRFLKPKRHKKIIRTRVHHDRHDI